ncbi:MAG: hypothetical protein ABWY64_08890 [Tardiphaga sp.]|jgi:hypothetical protein
MIVTGRTGHSVARALPIDAESAAAVMPDNVARRLMDGSVTEFLLFECILIRC